MPNGKSARSRARFLLYYGLRCNKMIRSQTIDGICSPPRATDERSPPPLRGGIEERRLRFMIEALWSSAGYARSNTNVMVNQSTVQQQPAFRSG